MPRAEVTPTGYDLPGGERGRPWRRWAKRLAIVTVVVLVLPIPWLHVHPDAGFAPGSAWRLDGRLEIDGVMVDPPGEWSWLVAGRPQLVGEAVWNAVVGTGGQARDMRGGMVTRSPALAEPAAAAIGLRAAGREVPLGLVVEVRDPVRSGYPTRAVIATIDGLRLTDRQTWREVSSAWEEEAELPTSPDPREIVFTLPDGRRFTAPGPGLPYRVVNTLDVAPIGLEAGISFKLARRLPVDWFRNLSLGNSHGAMVALTTYAHVSGRDLAQGRHIAGTGGIRGDGLVTPIGGLPAKARAAKRAGADVLVIPASQADELEGEDLGRLRLLPVRTLGEAIAWLEQPVAEGRPPLAADPAATSGTATHHGSSHDADRRDADRRDADRR